MQAYMSTGFPEKAFKLPKNFKVLEKEYKEVYKHARGTRSKNNSKSAGTKIQ